MFDPYLTWLGIPTTQRPPTYYQILGIPPSEFNNEAIEAAALRRMSFVRAHQTGPQAAECRRVLQEIMRARDTLVDPQRRRVYDAASPDATPWESALPPKSEPLPSPVSAAPGGGSPWWSEATLEHSDAEAHPATKSRPASEAGSVGIPTVPGRPATPPVQAQAGAGAPWWKQSAPVITPPASQMAAPAATGPTSFPPPLYEPLPPDVYLDPLADPAPATAGPRAGAAPGQPLVEFDAFAQPTTGRRRGGGGMFAFTALLLLAAGGVVAFFIWKKDATVPPAVPEVAEVPANKPAPVAEVVRETPAPKIVPKKEIPKLVKKDTPRPVEPVKPVQKDRPAAVKTPAPSAPDDLNKPKQYKGHDAGVLSVAVAPDGQSFVSIGEDKRVVRWLVEGDQGAQLHEFANPGVAVAFLHGKQEIASCDGGSVVVIDLVAMAARRKMTNPRGSLSCLASDADGVHVLTGGTDGTLRWWDSAAQKQAREFDVSEAAVTAVTVSPDGKLAAAGTVDGLISTWNLVAGKPVKKWKAHAGAVNALAFDPDGKRLLSVGADRSGAVWGFDSGKVQSKLAAVEAVPLAAAWCNDGKRVLTAGIDRSVRLWDAATGKLTGPVGVAAGKVFALAVDPADRFVLVGTSVGVVNRFPLSAGR